jgi:hypothetical protein
VNDLQLADKVKRLLTASGATASNGTFITSHDLQDQIKAEGGFDISNSADHRQYYGLLAYLKKTGVVNVDGSLSPLRVQLA